MSSSLKLLFYSLTQKILSISRSMAISHGNVIMFHHIFSDNLYRHDPSTSINKESFELFISHLYNAGYNFKPLSDLSLSSSKKDIFITFDDGFSDTYTIAYPFLKKMNIPFTIFLTVNYIGKEGYIGIDEILEISKDKNVLIGNHTYFHRVSRFLTKNDFLKDVINTNNYFEKRFNVTLKYFAFPYGSIYACSSKNIEIIKSLPFDYAFSTIDSKLTKKQLKNRCFVSRRNIYEKNYKEYIKRFR